jgi:hypothetical protein
MDTQNPFDKGCDAIRTQVVDLLPAVRSLLVNAQEEAPVQPQGGMSVDEAQAEVAENVTLALRDLESAAMRLNVAKHVYLGDSTLLPAPAAASSDSSSGQADASSEAEGSADEKTGE